MRGIGWFASAIALVTAVLLPNSASADAMDPALGRLVADPICRRTGPNGGLYYNPAAQFTRCKTDDAAFAKLIAQYGFAIAPTAMHSARTTGFGGFELAIEAGYTSIDSDAAYWQQGTQGTQDKNSKNFSKNNPSPASVLQSYSIKIRKGFPFGLELTGQVGYLAQTNIVFGGADVRISVFEGFRRGIPAVFPELAVGGGVRTITGTEAFQLTVAGFDAQLSKPIPIAGTVVLTPYAGYQWIRIFGDSGTIDLTPNTDAVDYCGASGTNTPANPDPNKSLRDGQPVCYGVDPDTGQPSANRPRGSAADFNNTAVFDAIRLTRHRLIGGLQFRFQMIRFGAHFAVDLADPEKANQGTDYEWENPDTGAQENRLAGVKRQFTIALDLGAVF
jgi:hypothetical protein